MIAAPVHGFCAARRRIGAIRVVETPVEGSVAITLGMEVDYVVLGLPGRFATEPLVVGDLFDYDEILAEQTCQIRRTLRGMDFTGAQIAAALEA